MEAENFNKWLVSDLKQYLLQNNIELDTIKGTGKNGNVVKNDLIKTAKKIKSNFISTQSESTTPIPVKDGSLMPNIDILPLVQDNLDLPMDIINEILNISDVNTIINFCNSSMLYQKHCNKQLWEKIAIREGMPIRTTVNEWIKEYLYHQYEVNILIEMLKNEIFIDFNLPTPYLLFKFKNILNYNGNYTITIYKGNYRNRIMVSEEEMIKLLMKLLYQFPNVYLYRHPEIVISIPLRKRHLKYFINELKLKDRKKSTPYKNKNALKIWYQYYN